MPTYVRYPLPCPRPAPITHNYYTSQALMPLASTSPPRFLAIVWLLSSSLWLFCCRCFVVISSCVRRGILRARAQRWLVCRVGYCLRCVEAGHPLPLDTPDPCPTRVQEPDSYPFKNAHSRASPARPCVGAGWAAVWGHIQPAITQSGASTTSHTHHTAHTCVHTHVHTRVCGV